MKRSKHKTIAVLFFFVVCIFYANNLKCQTTFKNNIKLHASSLYIAKRIFGQIPFAQYGVSYERKILKHFGLGLNFSKWTVSLCRELEYYEPLSAEEIVPGVLGYRNNYKSLNLYGHYTLTLSRSHHLNGGVGASYTWGTDGYVESYSAYKNGNTIYCEITQYDYQKADYWGGLAQLSYDYTFLNDRLNIGVDFRATYYKGFTPLHLNYGVHAGVGF